MNAEHSNGSNPLDAQIIVRNSH